MMLQHSYLPALIVTYYAWQRYQNDTNFNTYLPARCQLCQLAGTYFNTLLAESSIVYRTKTFYFIRP